MELLWKHAYSLMKISPSEAPVLLTEANQNPSKHRKKMLEIFFEKFQAPAALVAIQGVLSLYLLFNLVMQQVNQQVLSWTLEMESHMLFLSMKDTPLPIAVRELTLEVVMSLNICEIFSEKVVLIWTPALNLNSLRTWKRNSVPSQLQLLKKPEKRNKNILFLTGKSLNFVTMKRKQVRFSSLLKKLALSIHVHFHLYSRCSIGCQ